MKAKIAAFLNKYGNKVFIEELGGRCWADEQSDYVRVTETAEIELPDLCREDIVKARLETLDATEKRLKAEFRRAIDGLQDQREKLLALPAQ